MLRPLLIAMALATATPALAQSPDADSGLTGMTIITPKGYVSVESHNDWPVIATQSKLPVAVIAFQIPDPAAADTDAQSTNLAVTLCDPTDAKGQDTLKMYGASLGGPVTSESYKTWTVYTQTANDGGTAYTIIDAVSPIADVNVAVRLAWPHLDSHVPDYDAGMRALMLDELDHVTGGLGAFSMPKDATAWRPTGK